MNKTCSRCLQELPLSDFPKDKTRSDGYCYVCRACKRNYRKKSYLKNKPKWNIQSEEYYTKNKEKILLYSANWYQKNKERTRERKRVSNSRYSQRVRSDPFKKLKCNLRSRISEIMHLVRKGKSGELPNTLLGCSMSFLKDFLEKQFTPLMTWDNYGDYWTVDHIVPVSWATSMDDLAIICHYSNLRPLDIVSNSKKSNLISDI